jgi:predicted AlkP superfamily phosphohydrolase/phosphomutase/Flp pilus assembly protein TadD
MKRALIVIILVVILAGAAVAALLIKRVPDAHEGIRVTWSGELIVYDQGYHFIPPGTRGFVLYPTGRVEYRYPRYGSAEVLTENGEPVSVVFEVELNIPPGSARKLYERFSEEFDDAVPRLVQAAAEIEAAGVSASADRRAYRDAVERNVRDELSDLGVSVLSFEMPVWGDQLEAGTDGVAERPLRKLVIVGVDGADWLNLQPLVEAGKLPNFGRLLEGGATGPLRTIEPMLSPLLWTTIATGKYPEDHGILNFTIVDPASGKKVPITRHYRTADAFWNYLGDYGRRVAVVGWLATHPAERVNGVVVTDKTGYLAFAPEDRDLEAAGTVYPEDRVDEISRLVVRGAEVPYEECESIIHVGRDVFDKHRALEFDPKDSINNLVLLYASTRTFENIGLHLLERDRPDLLAVYFEWIDAVSHLFMLHSAPRMDDIAEGEFRMFKDAVEQSYIVQDAVLGGFMDRMDDETVLMVISDHGFKAGGSRLKNRPEIWAGNAAKWHRPNGVVALYGNGIKKGHAIEGATILDVAPTVLALQGLPRAADMPGTVLDQAFEPALKEGLNNTILPTLQREREKDEPVSAAGSAVTAEAMKKLEALGYLTPDNADALNNLGQRYQERGQFLKAIEEYKKAIELRPKFYSAYNNLAVCYGELGRLDEAEKALLKTIELKSDDFYAMNNLAVTYIKLRRLGDARLVAEHAIAIEPGYVNGRITLGSIYGMMGEYKMAEREFLKALELDPEAPGAADNLEKVRKRM